MKITSSELIALKKAFTDTPGMSSQYVTMPKNAAEFQYLGDQYEKGMLRTKETISRLKEKLEYHKAKAGKWEKKYMKLKSYIVNGDTAISWVIREDDAVFIYWKKKREKIETFSSRKEAETWIFRTFGVEVQI